MTEADKARFLASLAVYVAPQIEGESFGIVLLEAMAAGAPVVASDLPAFRDLTRQGTLAALFAVGDSDALATAVNNLLDDPARTQRLRELGRAAAAEYDWSRIVGDVEAVYAAVVSTPRVQGA